MLKFPAAVKTTMKLFKQSQNERAPLDALVAWRLEAILNSEKQLQQR
jgi:hypothetical protein